MSRPKPKWGWESGGTFPPNPFEEDDFQRITAVLEVSAFNEKIHSQLVEATQKYFIHKNFLNERPRSSKVNAALEDIHNKAKALADCLKRLDGATREKMMMAYTAPAKEMADNGNKEVQKDQKELKKLIEKGIIVPSASLTATGFFTMIDRCKSYAYKVSGAAKRAMSDLKNLPLDKGGPPANLALRFFIGELKEIYEEATGKKAGAPYIKYEDSIALAPRTKHDIKTTTDGMSEKPIRRCRICDTPLSGYNKSDICFCHDEHLTNGKSDSEETLDDETAKQMPKEAAVPSGPFFRFVSCVLGIIDPSITKSTIFWTMKSKPKKTS